MNHSGWCNCEECVIARNDKEICHTCGSYVGECCGGGCEDDKELLTKIVAVFVMFDGHSYAVVGPEDSCLLQIVEGGDSSFVGLRGTEEELTNLTHSTIQIDRTMTSDCETGQISLV